MKLASLLLLLGFVSSCSGVKVLKEPPPQQQSRPGVHLTGKVVDGGVTVKKVGFWCDARNGLMTFGAFGPTEAESRANAQSTCHRMYKDSPCEIAACKPVQQ